MDNVAAITSHLSEKFRQDSRYEFKSGDYLSNFMVGTDTLDSILPDLFAEDGRLKDIGDNINLSDQERQVLAEAFKNADKNKELMKLYTPEEKFLAIDCLKARIPELEEYNTWYEKVIKTNRFFIVILLIMR